MNEDTINDDCDDQDDGSVQRNFGSTPPAMILQASCKRDTAPVPVPLRKEEQKKDGENNDRSNNGKPDASPQL